MGWTNLASPLARSLWGIKGASITTVLFSSMVESTVSMSRHQTHEKLLHQVFQCWYRGSKPRSTFDSCSDEGPKNDRKMAVLHKSRRIWARTVKIWVFVTLEANRLPMIPLALNPVTQLSELLSYEKCNFYSINKIWIVLHFNKQNTKIFHMDDIKYFLGIFLRIFSVFFYEIRKFGVHWLLRFWVSFYK